MTSENFTAPNVSSKKKPQKNTNLSEVPRGSDIQTQSGNGKARSSVKAKIHPPLEEISSVVHTQISNPTVSEEDYARIFNGAEQFLALLIKFSPRTDQVVARSYGNGAWHQFSGRDFCAHLGRACDNWLRVFPWKDRAPEASLLFLVRNSYSSFVSSLGAMLAGLNVMFMPSQASAKDVSWCLKHFRCIGLATDIEELIPELSVHDLPVHTVARAPWIPQDSHDEPALFKLFRDSRTVPEIRLARAQRGFDSKNLWENDVWEQLCVGKMQFISFGNDGFQKPEELSADALVTTAQNFLLHANIPASVSWKSVECLLPANPFAHLSRFCALLKNGVVGFPDLSADWETNLRILRPTYLFANVKHLNVVSNFIEEVAVRPGFRSRVFLGSRIEQARELLNSGRALRLSESVFSFAKGILRTASRLSVGGAFVKEAIEDLRFVVHGLEPADREAIQILDKLGIPVLETFGTTSSAGMLSSNLYDAPHFNLIGSPLPHVSFRLGNDSTLEYRLSLPSFKTAGIWQETGDMAQMTPHGFSIIGRRRHLFVTAGGITVSPVRLEQMLRSYELIADVCLVGDKMPYLGALIVLTNEAYSDFRSSPDSIKSRVQDIISKVNESLPRSTTIKKFVILDKPFQDSLGEKLPTGTMNRLRIQQTRESVIAGLYE